MWIEQREFCCGGKSWILYKPRRAWLLYFVIPTSLIPHLAPEWQELTVEQSAYEICAYSFLVGNNHTSRQISRITEPPLSPVVGTQRQDQITSSIPAPCALTLLVPS